MLAWQVYDPDGSAESGAFLHVPELARHGIEAVFTSRLGGVSAKPWETLNLSFVSGDDPAAVIANRTRALGALQLDASRWTGGKQVHGANVARITAGECGAGAESPATTIPDTDALWTEEAGIALAVLVADCVPILFADSKARRIAVVHAGWRGLVGGVVEAAASAFDEPGRVIAVAGPSIGPCCYEVGREAAEPARERFGDGVIRDRHLDLWAASVAAMRSGGVKTITVAALCTRCESHRFFSHRAGDTGRQGILACLTP